MPTDAKSYEVGAVSYPADERKRLARQSIDWVCSTCKCKASSLLASDSQVSILYSDPVAFFCLKRRISPWFCFSVKLLIGPGKVLTVFRDGTSTL